MITWLYKDTNVTLQINVLYFTNIIVQKKPQFVDWKYMLNGGEIVKKVSFVLP